MIGTTRPWLALWSSRAAGVLVALFLAVFALDAFDGRKTFVEALPAFVIHLGPAGLVLAAVGFAWRRPGIGALLFAGLAAAYALSVRRPDWILAISGPLVIVSALYGWSWWCRAATRVSGSPG